MEKKLRAIAFSNAVNFGLDACRQRPTGATTSRAEGALAPDGESDFNLADSCIVVGGILLVLHSLIAAREE